MPAPAGRETRGRGRERLRHGDGVASIPDEARLDESCLDEPETGGAPQGCRDVRPGRSGPAGEEIVVVVDDHNRPVAELPRRRVRDENLPHRATCVFVFDRRGRVLVQRRTAGKDLYPGFYDLAAGGVVAAGESYEQCAEREAAEELGIRDTALVPEFDFHYRDERNRCFSRVFTCVYDGPFTLQPEEVESVKFHTVGEIASGGIAPVTPDTLIAFNRLLESGAAAGR